MSLAPVGALWEGEPYVRSSPVLRFVLHGAPQPQGSKTYRGQTREGRPILADAVKGLKPWRAAVVTAIKDAIATTDPPPCGFPLIGPVSIDLVFSMTKPKSAPVRRLTYPITKPDADKLERAVLDAGTIAGLWGDDSQVVHVAAWKVYPAETPRSLSRPGLLATVHTIGAQPTAVNSFATQMELV